MKVSQHGPDFLIIGAQRAGTTWTNRVLKQHPAIWVPPVKELHYFDKPNCSRTWLDSHERRRVRPKSFDRWHLRYLFGRRSKAWYLRLFEDARAQGFIVGEVTPTYATLQPEVFRCIHALNSEIKLAFIMRDPLERAWSQVNKAFIRYGRGGAITVPMALQIAHWPGVVQSSAYLDTVERIEAVFPRSQLYYGFFDDLREEPQAFATGLLSFLGVDPGKMGALPGPVNVVAGQSPIPDAFASSMAREYLPMVRALSDRFDGPPRRWLARYEKLLESAPLEV